MDWMPVSLEGDTVRRSRLLETCRQTESGEAGSPPEPAWVRSDEGTRGYRILWSPGRSVVERENRALELRGTEDPDWLLTLRLWARYRTLSALEKADVFRYLSDQGVSVEEICECACPVLDLPGSPVWVRAYRGMAGLPDTIRSRLHEGELPPRLLRFLLEIPDPFRDPLIVVLEQGRIHFSVQEGRRLSEAARRLGEDVLSDWNRALETLDPDRSPRDRGQRFLDRVEAWAFPETTGRKRRFQSELDELDLDGRLIVEPPPNFEGGHLKFRFRCDRNDDLSILAEEVKRCRNLFQYV